MKELFIETPMIKYPIYVNNTFEQLPLAFEKAGLKGRKLCIITESNVEKLYLEEITNILSPEYEVCFYSFKAGEKSKNLDTISDFYDYFVEQRLDRKSVLVALGGGVTGDMTGFAAATYMRGIPFVQIPTTLLAQVDSSVGGKTGVDFKGNKNMVGAFYQPHFVYINSKTLNTLPSREYSAGIAEAVKYGYIINKDFLEFCFDNKQALKELNEQAVEQLIYTSCQAKAYVVGQDEKEKGLREILNFGHTFGHSIETLSGFKLLHGECVAIGMVCALYLTMLMGKAEKSDVERLEDILSYFDLPIRAEEFDTQEIYNQMFYDKKTKNGVLNIVLLEKIGQAYTENKLDEALIKKAIKYLKE